MVADLLGQVTGGEGHGEEGGRGETATVDGAPQGVAEEEMEDTAGQVGRWVEERSAFPIEARQGVEGAQGGDRHRQAESGRAEGGGEKNRRTRQKKKAEPPRAS